MLHGRRIATFIPERKTIWKFRSLACLWARGSIAPATSATNAKSNSPNEPILVDVACTSWAVAEELPDDVAWLALSVFPVSHVPCLPTRG